MSDAATLLGLLADDDRLRVVAALALGASTTAEVRERTGLDARTAGRALARLEDAGIVHADGLEDAVNAYLDSQGGSEVIVPFRLTSNTQGTYFLTDLRATPSTDYDLIIPGGISVTDVTPTETDIIQV